MQPREFTDAPMREPGGTCATLSVMIRHPWEAGYWESGAFVQRLSVLSPDQCMLSHPCCLLRPQGRRLPSAHAFHRPQEWTPFLPSDSGRRGCFRGAASEVGPPHGGGGGVLPRFPLAPGDLFVGQDRLGGTWLQGSLALRRNHSSSKPPSATPVQIHEHGYQIPLSGVRATTSKKHVPKGAWTCFEWPGAFAGHWWAPGKRFSS